jgi:hypothetical protein
MLFKCSHGQLQFHFGKLMLTFNYPKIVWNVQSKYKDGSPKDNTVSLHLPTGIGWRGKSWAWDWAVFLTILGFGPGIGWNHVDGRSAHNQEEKP